METSSPLISAVPISLVFSAVAEMECVDVKVISFPTVRERRNSLASKAQSCGGCILSDERRINECDKDAWRVKLRYELGVLMRTNLFIRGGGFNFRRDDVCEVQNPGSQNLVRARKTRRFRVGEDAG